MLRILKSFFAILLVILIIVSQLTIWPRLAIGAAAPNLVLAIVLVLAILKDFRYWWLALAMGLAIDLLADRFFGVFTLDLIITFLFINWLARNLFKKSGWLAFLILTFVGVLFFQSIEPVIFKIINWWPFGEGVKKDFSWLVWLNSLWLNLILSLAVLLVSKKINVGEK